ncbi:AraC-like DNA-binding protein [Bradyrhizobium huanghuaihaiense]
MFGVTLATRLGISSRHLARLFERHVGATPQQLAKTLRVQRAKRLLDAGDHTITEIAFLAGFGSLRRFNAAFAELYGRSPSRLRSSKRSPSEKAGAEIEAVGQAQHEHKQRGGRKQRKLPENEFTRRGAGNNGFLRNGHERPPV